jgi:hypothetical protein
MLLNNTRSFKTFKQWKMYFDLQHKLHIFQCSYHFACLSGFLHFRYTPLTTFNNRRYKPAVQSYHTAWITNCFLLFCYIFAK